MWGNGLSWAEPDYKEGKPGNKIATGAAVVPGREVSPPPGHISTNAAMLEQLSRPEWQQQA